MKNKTTKRLLTMTMALAFALSSTVFTPTTVSAAATKTVTVKTQKQLDAALKDTKTTSIVIKTSKNVTLKIKEGDYEKKSLTVSTPKATINNYGDFKKISINDGKYFIDRGDGNNIVVKDTNPLKLTTGKQSSGTQITISGKGGKISIVNNGSVDEINVKSKCSITVNGNAKEAPTITNNAAGAEIVTAMDANVVLNKAATLTVKAGVGLGTLAVNADSKITVAEGATAEDITIAGSAAKVDLTVNGTVDSVTVAAKVELAVSGTTTATVAITNNAQGAAIQSEVKTDVTLNADAKVSLDKGAEGSSVTVGSADVKPVVENKTDDKVTVTDSTGKETAVEAGKDTGSTTTPTTPTTPDTGNTGGGSTGGGGGSSYYPPSSGDSGNSGTQTVTITPTITMMGGATVLKPGVELKASATNSANANVTYSYSWVCGEESVGTTDTYTVSKWDSGDTITVWVTAVIGGKEVSGYKTTDIVKIVGHPYESYAARNVPFGTPDNEVTNYLPGSTLVANEFDETMPGTITWASSDYNGNIAGTYTFTGTIALPNEYWVWSNDDQNTVTATVTVLEKGSLLFSYEKFELPSDADTEEPAASIKYNQDCITVSNGIYDCNITGGNRLKLKECKLNDSNAKWIGVNVTLSAGETELGTIYCGTDKTASSQVSNNDGALSGVSIGDNVYVTENNSPENENVYTVWLKADKIVGNQEVIYFKNGVNGVATPVTFHFTENIFDLTGVTFADPNQAASVTAGKIGETTETIDQLLPSTLRFSDADGTTYDLGVTWTISPDYQTHAGTYDATPALKDGYPVTDTKVNYTGVKIKVVVEPGTQAAKVVSDTQ